MAAAEGRVVLQLLGAGLQKACFSAVGAPGLRAVQESFFTSSRWLTSLLEFSSLNIAVPRASLQ